MSTIFTAIFSAIVWPISAGMDLEEKTGYANFPGGLKLLLVALCFVIYPIWFTGIPIYFVVLLFRWGIH